MPKEREVPVHDQIPPRHLSPGAPFTILQTQAEEAPSMPCPQSFIFTSVAIASHYIASIHIHSFLFSAVWSGCIPPSPLLVFLIRFTLCSVFAVAPKTPEFVAQQLKGKSPVCANFPFSVWHNFSSALASLAQSSGCPTLSTDRLICNF